MLEINGETLSPRLIILDKDGTLIAFQAMWHTWFDRFLGYIGQQTELTLEARIGLAGTLGYDPVDGDWDPLGPLTLASTGEVLLLTASQLYHYQGLAWDEALDVVQRAERFAREILDDTSLLQTIGDVHSRLHEFTAAGYMLALVTTDTRASTRSHLDTLRLSEFFGAIVCGDDGIPLKPAPDMALEVCRRLQVDPSEAIMIGDSAMDMVMARTAGLAAAIGVASGSMPGETLASYADLVIADIHAIEIRNGEVHDALSTL
ncbi:MAG: HAD family hydrolase [Anaerolineae bacterium]